MTTAEMKNILADKLKAEQTYFTKSHISIKKQGEKYKIVIKDYEHLPFYMSFEYDNYFGYTVMIANDSHKIISFVENKKDYDIKTALVELGYYIGTRF